MLCRLVYWFPVFWKIATWLSRQMDGIRKRFILSAGNPDLEREPWYILTHKCILCEVKDNCVSVFSFGPLRNSQIMTQKLFLFYEWWPYLIYYFNLFVIIYPFSEEFLPYFLYILLSCCFYVCLSGGCLVSHSRNISPSCFLLSPLLLLLFEPRFLLFILSISPTYPSPA